MPVFRFAVLWIFAASSLSAAAAVRVAGSDVVGEHLRAALEAFARAEDRPLMCTFAGSRPGRLALERGEADVAVLVLAPGETPPTGPLVDVPLAYVTVVAVAPATLPLEQLDLAQLAEVFGAEGAAVPPRWDQLGAAGEWAGRAVLPHLTGPTGGLAHDLFRQAVLRGPQLKAAVVVHDRAASALAAIRRAEGGLAIVPAPPAGEAAVKVLRLARAAGEVAYEPSPEHVHAGDYPVAVPVRIAFRRDRAAELLPILRYLLSEDFVPVLTGAGLVPLPRDIRHQLVFELEFM